MTVKILPNDKGNPPGKLAAAYLAQWCQRFAGQGYYAAADGRRIPVAELVAACTFEPVKGGDR